MLPKELWEKEPVQFIKGGIAYRRKRKTKKQLVEEFEMKGGEQMPKIGTKVQESADDVKLNVPYEITSVEEMETQVQKLQGYRVNLLTVKAEEGNVVLWARPVTGVNSKLGVFITQLGDNTDKWLHKWLIFRVWSERNRVMEVVEVPSPKVSTKTSKKAS